MSNLNDIFFTPAANQELTYDQVLEDVQRYFAENHASTIAEAGEGNAERATSLLKELMEHYIVKRKYALDGLSTKELCSKLYEDMAGYSFLKKWIYKPGVEEVNINAYNDIEVIESSGRSIKIPDKFSSPQHAIDVIRRMLNACGMVIDDTMPSIVGFLDKNIRISVDKTPIVDADVGVNASIRIVNQQTVSEEKLLNSGSATAEMLHFLTACIPMAFLIPLLVPILIGLAVALWFSTYYAAFDFVKKRRKLIEGEIPRFALTVGQSLENDRDVLKILTSYRRVAGKDFGAELDQTIADMKTGNYENALIRFETRIGSPMLSDVIRGLIGVLRGDDQRMYFKMITFDMRQIEQNNLKKEAAKRPKKIQRYSMMMLICIMIIYLVVLCTEVMSSLGAFFG